jgi:hypothetical protein
MDESKFTVQDLIDNLSQLTEEEKKYAVNLEGCDCENLWIGVMDKNPQLEEIRLRIY